MSEAPKFALLPPLPIPVVRAPTVTGWFPGRVAPVWPGEYEVQLCVAVHGTCDERQENHSLFRTYAYDIMRWTWTGYRWADPHGLIMQLTEDDRWRGQQL